ncbi:MAG: hypothetical protein L0I76_16250 [Pseudonocardia sp.]|nr:hypothetical protein [Pseudonocardia sp.]
MNPTNEPVRLAEAMAEAFPCAFWGQGPCGGDGRPCLRCLPGQPVAPSASPPCSDCGQPLLLAVPGRTVCERCRLAGVTA